jgi:hypothetical protein
MRSLFFSSTFFFFSFAICFSQARYYVNLSAAGTQSGLNWADAFSDLQPALAMAHAGDTIWIAEGTYLPTQTADRAASFSIPSGVRIFGGFGGFESGLNQRDWTNHQTVLSGDIGIPADSTDNSYNVLYMSAPDSGTVLDGLIIRNGLANNSAQANSPYDRVVCGGGLYIEAGAFEAYPDIRNCRFEHNSALRNGGGVFVNGTADGPAAGRFLNCIFEANHAGQNGGGMARFGKSWIDWGRVFENCAFNNNYAGGRGGGLYFDYSSGSDSLVIWHSIFQRNKAQVSGGGVFFIAGRPQKSNISIYGSSFIENESPQGASIEITSNLDYFSGIIKIRDCEFKKNRSNFASNSASIIWIDQIESSGTNMLIENCVFLENLSLSTIIFSELPEAKAFINNVVFQNNNGGLIHMAELKELNIENSFINHNSSTFFEIENVTDAVNLSNDISIGDSTLQYSYFNLGNCPNVLIRQCTFTKISSKFFNNNNLNIITNNIMLINSILSNSINQTFFDHGSSSNIDKVFLANSYLNNFNCTNPGFGITCGPGLITSGDPLFADPANSDYRLQPCSLLVNAGDNTAAAGLGTDLAGQPRIQGGTVDMGAYETPAPKLAPDPAVSPACHNVSNGSANLQMENGCPPYQFFWSSGSNTGQALTALPAGNYLLTVTDARGSTCNASFTVPEGNNLSLTPQSTPVICGDTIGGYATAQVSGGVGPFSFNWQGSTDSVYANLAPGDYPLTVTDAIGCTATSSVSVTKTGNLSIAVNTTAISCFGSADGSFVISPLNGKPPYQWNWKNGPMSPAYGPLGPGTYNGTVTDAFGCSIIWELPLSQPDSFYFDAIVTPATDSVAGNGSIKLYPIIGGTQPYLVQWSNGQHSVEIDNLKPGSYAVTIYDHNGCFKTAVYQVPFTLATTESRDTPVISIFPNPGRNEVHVRVLTATGKALSRIRVINALGQKMTDLAQVQPDQALSVTEWPAGIYRVLLWFGDEALESRSLLIIR